MIKQNITPQDLCDFLNELIAIDEPAIRAIIEYRVPCNEAMSDHETVQVGYINISVPSEGWNVGMLGILNGLFGVNENHWGCIIQYLNDDKTIQKFEYNPNMGDKALSDENS